MHKLISVVCGGNSIKSITGLKQQVNQEEGYIQYASSDVLIPPERINYLVVGYTAPI
jgi:hypothetical protein